MEDLRPPDPVRWALQGLAIISALAFLTLVMVHAMAVYGTPPKPKNPLFGLRAPATKAAPVLAPRLRAEQEAREAEEAKQAKEAQDRAYLGGTKSLTVVPPPPVVQPRQPPEERAYLPATKAGILGPLKVSPPAPAPQPQAAPPPRN